MPFPPASPKNRGSIAVGAVVDVVRKEDRRTGKTPWGTVAEILTNSASHPHGIKVRLRDGTAGRVRAVHQGREKKE